MANEHIRRLSQIGLGKESTAGTAVAVSTWLPTSQGTYLPKYEIKFDPSAYGVIDENKQGQTMRVWSEIDFQGEARDKWFGNILLALFGTEYSCVRFPISALSGTYTLGETITETTSAATGTLRRDDSGGSSPALYIVPVSGTFTGGKTLTGGTSAATSSGGTIEAPASVRYHVYKELQTNNPQTYTIYHHDPVATDERSTYGALNTLDFEVVSNDWAKFTTKWMAKALASTSAQVPSYTADNGFFGKNVTVKTAANFNSLDAAAAINVEKIKLSFAKNLEASQAFGGTAVTSIHNKQFAVKGDMVLLYNATTQRDYLTNSTDQALRITLANTAVTIGSATSPTLQFDMADVFFTSFSINADNNGLVRQTLQFTATFDITRSNSCECLLANTTTAAY